MRAVANAILSRPFWIALPTLVLAHWLPSSVVSGLLLLATLCQFVVWQQEGEAETQKKGE